MYFFVALNFLAIIMPLLRSR